ncbi:glycosyltransferase [Sphingomonas sp. Leaf343]|uniref:glycosyltransferase n=1 Tax=Sphingomonas sp. Leaf343 TaxID=1736345 RepID=UPI0006FB1835|nr:glycosyltransferase [Sphingomonas sp. Leaf343]KQR82299.1 glycosyl transferase [Sphingomonas sp. Leaf343]
MRAPVTPARRHVAIVSPPTAGHLNPLQVLGGELIALGHRVTFVHGGDVAAHIADDRIGFAPLPTSIALAAYLKRLADPTGPAGLMRMIRATAGLTRLLLDEAPAVLERIGADAVIADAAEPAGPLIAARLGIPHVISVTGLPLLRETAVPPPFVGWRYRTDPWGRHRNWAGYTISDLLLRPITQVLEERRRAWRLAETDERDTLQIAQCPRSLDYPRTALPPGFRYGGPWRAEDDEEVVLPDDGRPLVFCSLGTLQGSRRAVFAKIADACARIGARAVIAHGGGLSAEEEATLPGDPLVRAFWPQRAVLRHSAAAVLHGGFNSVLDALAAGVPMIVLPIAFEQPGTAARVAHLGAGRIVSPTRASARDIATALADVIGSPHYRAAARRLSGEIATAGGAPAAAAAVSAGFILRA